MKFKSIDEALAFIMKQTEGGNLTTSVLRELILVYKRIHSIEYDVEDLINLYEEKQGIQTFVPTIISDDTIERDWFNKSINVEGFKPQALDRYLEFLKSKGFSANTVAQIRKNSIEAISKCANPLSETSDRRKGLVIGDVQSGKTSNFLALMNLASDVGYNVIVVLSGMTEYLRSQTQKRIDQGFIGARAETIKFKTEYIGVGAESKEYYAIPATNSTQDFTINTYNSIGHNPSDVNKPVVIVAKKNVSVLTRIKEWLTSDDGKHGTVKRNVLIIDDEADNASINTNKVETNPTKINGLIRDVYNAVKNSTYVGFTATPFANVFIDFDDDESYKDLFPSDFIIQLYSDSDYFGYKKVFDEGRVEVLDEDERGFLPATHKKGSSFVLTESLKTAIKVFILANAVRTLDKQEFQHRTMMINVSVFNDMQDEIYSVVDDYVKQLELNIIQSNIFPIEKYLQDQERKSLYDLYLNDDLFDNAREKFSWNMVKNALPNEVEKIETRVFNSKKEKFSYEDYDSQGTRLIVIGGYMLSRGLTLEGLMISYFNRSSKEYDTLLQMCRWFGYRSGYSDLCKIYMTQQNVDNFGAVMDAIIDLKEQFKEMNLKGNKPSDFGLMIKECPETLMTRIYVTAAVKRRHSEVRTIGLNYGGVIVDTIRLFCEQKFNENNGNQVNSFIQEIKNKEGILLKDVFVDGKGAKRKMFINVPKEYIAAMVGKLSVPYENRKFDTEALKTYINESKVFPKWDVVFAQGNIKENVEPIPIEKHEIIPILRTVVDVEGKLFKIGGSNNRLLEPGIFNSGLTESQLAIAESNMKNGGRTQKTARDYLRIDGRKPLLVIHPICFPREKLELASLKPGTIIWGFAIGFPHKEDGVMVKYRINKTKVAELRRERESIELEEIEEND